MNLHKSEVWKPNAAGQNPSQQDYDGLLKKQDFIAIFHYGLYTENWRATM